MFFLGVNKVLTGSKTGKLIKSVEISAALKLMSQKIMLNKINMN